MKKHSFLVVVLLSGFAQAASLDRSAAVELKLTSLSMPVLGTMAPSPFDDAALQAMPGLPLAAAIAAQNQATRQTALKNSAFARAALTVEQIRIAGRPNQAQQSLDGLYGGRTKLSAADADGVMGGGVRGNTGSAKNSVNKAASPRVSALPLMNIEKKNGVIRLRYDGYNGGDDSVYVSGRAGEKPAWGINTYGGHSFSAQALRDLKKSLRAEMAKIIKAIGDLGTISSASDRKQLARMYIAHHKMLAQVLASAE